MALNPELLQNVHKQGGKTVARCPACAEDGHDSTGNHLAIFEDGRFACVAYPGGAGAEHRKRIFMLVGDSRSEEPKPIEIRGFRRAAPFRVVINRWRAE